MRVEKFVDQVELLAEAFGVTTARLGTAFDPHSDERPRWIAVSGNRALGTVMASSGPDSRSRLYFRCRDTSAYQPLARAALAEVDGAAHVMVDGADVTQRKVLTSLGFVLDYTQDEYRAEFASAWRYLDGTPDPVGFSYLTADRADRSRWFTLDNTLRQDVRGFEGWRGDLAWFARDNYESPHFSPEAYLIAVEEANGEYAGLVRFWDGPGELPRLGMVAVARQYRGIGLGKALLARGVAAAARWRRPAFVGRSFRGSTRMRALWIAMGANDVGSQQSMVLRRLAPVMSQCVREYRFRRQCRQPPHSAVRA